MSKIIKYVLGREDIANEECIGYVDSITEHDISGWVLSKKDGKNFPAPVLYVNGKMVCHLKLTGVRFDVRDYFMRDAVGIYIKFGRYLLNGSNIIEVKFEETDSLIKNGRRVVEFNINTVAGKHWSKEYVDNCNLYIRWWQNDLIVSAINRRICGKNVVGLSQGLYQLVKRDYGTILPLSYGISVGGGCGQKEMDAIEAGLVSYFDIFEVSTMAVEKGRQIAKDRGLENKITFHLDDAFATVKRVESYDLVFWNNALHHMHDTNAAIKWSRLILKKGGLFVMDEYVGENRMQFPDGMLQISDAFRDTLPAEYFHNPYDLTAMMNRKCVRPDEDDLAVMDPSECADSINILPSIRKTFPEVKVILTGGGVYHLGLSDVIHNIIMAGDDKTLNRAMSFDDLCLEHGLTQYAIAYGKK